MTTSQRNTLHDAVESIFRMYNYWMTKVFYDTNLSTTYDGLMRNGVIPFKYEIKHVNLEEVKLENSEEVRANLAKFASEMSHIIAIYRPNIKKKSKKSRKQLRRLNKKS